MDKIDAIPKVCRYSTAGRYDATDQTTKRNLRGQTTMGLNRTAKSPYIGNDI